MSADLVPVQPAGNSAPSAPTPVRGRPFVKGQSGNPAGRPKGVDEFRKKVQREIKDGRKVLDYLVKALESRSPKERIDAATLLLAYAYGKPVQPTELTGDEGGPITFRVVYEDQEFDGRG